MQQPVMASLKSGLHRVEAAHARLVYEILLANADSASIAIDLLSFDEFFESIFSKSFYYFWLEEGDESPKALVSLGAADPIARRAEFGVISLSPRGGYATKALLALGAFAFRSMGLNCLYCVVNADNAPCLQLVNKLGRLTYEGRRRQSRLKNGQFLDQHVFSILASETEKWAPRNGGA